MPKLENILTEMKELLAYQTKLLEHLVENSKYKKSPPNIDEVLEKVADAVLPAGVKNIMPKEVLEGAINLAKEMNKEI